MINRWGVAAPKPASSKALRPPQTHEVVGTIMLQKVYIDYRNGV